MGHHSTSDDSYAYRARSEVEDRKRIDNPISRFKLFLESRGWWNEEEEEVLKTRLKNDVMVAFKKAESMKRNKLGELFTDVYGGEEPWNVVGVWSHLRLPINLKFMIIFSLQREQREELASLLKKYGDKWEPWRNELARFKDNGDDVIAQAKWFILAVQFIIM